MRPTAIIESLLGVLIAICLGLNTWLLNTQTQTLQIVAVLQEQVKELATDDTVIRQLREELEMLKRARDIHNRQNWKRDGWARDQINELRSREGLPLGIWPDLTVP